VAKKNRVQRAKRPLDETDLPMAQIAMRTGFASLRRFNAVFAEVYQRPPTVIRNAGRRQHSFVCGTAQTISLVQQGLSGIGGVSCRARRAFGIRSRRQQRPQGGRGCLLAPDVAVGYSAPAIMVQFKPCDL